MRTLNLDPRNLKKPLLAHDSLGERELGKLSTAFQPGEWILADDGKGDKFLLGYINPFINRGDQFRAMGAAQKSVEKSSEEEIAAKIIEQRIKAAVEKRNDFDYLKESCRLIFGGSDKLPGLVVDKVEKYLLVQINAMGIYRHLKVIEQILASLFPSLKIIHLQSKSLSMGEDIPDHSSDVSEEWISAVESDLRLSISKENLQKTGFYFDHRDNRKRLETLIKARHQKASSSVDLFSYLGAWGLTLLKAGVDKCVFVDQAKLESEFEKNLTENSFSERGTFVREDVFKYLDACKNKKVKFDIVVSDPPAFIKNVKDKKKAIVGYEKLHSKALSCVNDGGLFVAASCTQPVSIEEFDLTVKKSADRLNLEIEMLDIGIQSKDHPTESLSSKSNYIKYITYKISYKSEIK